jgi:hypothetical protein
VGGIRQQLQPSTKEFLDSGIGHTQNTNCSSESRQNSVLLGPRTVTPKDFHHSSLLCDMEF